MNALELIKALTTEHATPSSLLYLSNDATSMSAAVASTLPDSEIYPYQSDAALTEELSYRGRVEVAVLISEDETTAQAMIALAGRLRITHADRVWLALPVDASWQVSDLYALAMVEHDAPPFVSGRYRVFRYDLESYTRVREWNNARNWANPENFHRYRW